MTNEQANRAGRSGRANRWLVAAVVLQAGLLAGTWSGRAGGPSAAVAGSPLPNPAEQRLRQLDSLDRLEAQLDRIARLLESGRLQVRPVPPDENRDEAR